MNAVSREVQITNKRGLHARASAKFVGLASEIDAQIDVEKDGHRVCGTSIMGLMMLGAAMGDTITIHVQGMYADEALEKLARAVALNDEAAKLAPDDKDFAAVRDDPRFASAVAGQATAPGEQA